VRELLATALMMVSACSVVTGPTVTIGEGQWSVDTDRIDSTGDLVPITVGHSGRPNPGTYLVISGDANAVNTGRYARFDIGQPSN
jgi:hypothetical protein